METGRLIMRCNKWIIVSKFVKISSGVLSHDGKCWQLLQRGLIVDQLTSINLFSKVLCYDRF